MSTLPNPLQQALNAYKVNYAAYKVSGNAGNKTAYENALAIINRTMLEASSATTQNDQYLQRFISSYETTNQEIVDLHRKSKAIRKEGPAVQNQLAQSRQLHQRQIAESNDTGLYVKAGLVIALIVVVGIVGAL
jgi:hypothetical protein